MGHSDIRTTMRYAHLGQHTLSDAIKVLETAHTFDLRHNSVTPVIWGLQIPVIKNEKSPDKQKKKRDFTPRLFYAPGVGFEPTTNWLHLSKNFLMGWTISSSIPMDARRFLLYELEKYSLSG